MKENCELCSIKKSKFCFQHIQENRHMYLCKKCYDDLPKEKKKLLQCLTRKEKAGYGGFAVGGIIGQIGYRKGLLKSREKDKQKYNIKQIELDNLSIDTYNRHYNFLSSTNQQIILNKTIKNKIRKHPEYGEPANIWKTIVFSFVGIFLLCCCIYYSFLILGFDHLSMFLLIFGLVPIAYAIYQYNLNKTICKNCNGIAIIIKKSGDKYIHCKNCGYKQKLKENNEEDDKVKEIAKF